MEPKPCLLFSLLLLILVQLSLSDPLSKLEGSVLLAPEKRVRLIIWLKEGANPESLGSKFRVVRRLNSINALVVELDRGWLHSLPLEQIEAVRLDRRVRILREEAIPLIQADLAALSFGNGSGIRIGIIDTGIFNHTEFQHPNRIVAQQCFCSPIPGLRGGCCPDGTSHDDNATDDEGHGTHVAGIAAGKRGVAREAELIAVKVLDSQGIGWDSDVAAGIEWAVAQGAHIVSLSLGVGYDEYLDCYELASAQVVEAVARINKTLVVVAAGNDGPNSSTIASPGCAKSALTVGASYDTSYKLVDYLVCRDQEVRADDIACYSSRGPTKDGRIKPDLVAPGSIVNSTTLNDLYAERAGTSMSTPFVTGIAAILLESFNLTHGHLPAPAQAKAILLTGVKLLNYTRDVIVGSGRIDALEVLRIQNLTASDVLQPGEGFRHVVEVDGSQSDLIVTLYYPQNQTLGQVLSLRLISPSHNAFVPDVANQDNIKQIFISSPETGMWQVEVNATVVSIPQSYWLASNYEPSGVIYEVQVINIPNRSAQPIGSAWINVSVHDLNLNRQLASVTGSLDTIPLLFAYDEADEIYYNRTTFSFGNHTLVIDAMNGTRSGSTFLTFFAGTYNVSILSPTPSQKFLRGQSIPLTANVSYVGQPHRAWVNGTIAVNLTSLAGQSIANITLPDPNRDGAYVGSYAIKSTDPLGMWKVPFNATNLSDPTQGGFGEVVIEVSDRLPSRFDGIFYYVAGVGYTSIRGYMAPDYEIMVNGSINNFTTTTFNLTIYNHTAHIVESFPFREVGREGNFSQIFTVNLTRWNSDTGEFTITLYANDTFDNYVFNSTTFKVSRVLNYTLPRVERSVYTLEDELKLRVEALNSQDEPVYDAKVTATFVNLTTTAVNYTDVDGKALIRLVVPSPTTSGRHLIDIDVADPFRWAKVPIPGGGQSVANSTSYNVTQVYLIVSANYSQHIVPLGAAINISGIGLIDGKSTKPLNGTVKLRVHGVVDEQVFEAADLTTSNATTGFYNFSLVLPSSVGRLIAEVNATNFTTLVKGRNETKIWVGIWLERELRDAYEQSDWKVSTGEGLTINGTAWYGRDEERPAGKERGAKVNLTILDELGDVVKMESEDLSAGTFGVVLNAPSRVGNYTLRLKAFDAHGVESYEVDARLEVNRLNLTILEFGDDTLDVTADKNDAFRLRGNVTYWTGENVTRGLVLLDLYKTQTSERVGSTLNPCNVTDAYFSCSFKPVDFGAIADGNYTLGVRITDLDGISGATNLTFRVRSLIITMAPSTTSLTAGKSVTLAGEASYADDGSPLANRPIYLLDEMEPLSLNTTTASDGSYSFSFTLTKNGTHVLKLMTNDSLGVDGSNSTSLRVYPPCPPCTEWSECIEGVQTRTCYAPPECTPYPESRACELPAPAYLSIVSYPTLVVVEQGGFNSTELRVNNTHPQLTQEVRLRLEGVPEGWFSIRPASFTIYPLQVVGFVVNFTPPSDARIADYAGRFIASSEKAEVGRDFTLRVLPSLEFKLRVNETLSELRDGFTELWSQLNQSKQVGVNVSKAESLFELLRSKLEEAEELHDRGDYLATYKLLGEMRSLLNQTQAELELAIEAWEETKTKMFWKTVELLTIMGVVGAVIGLLIYLFWPTKRGYYPGKKKYVYKKEGLLNRLRKRLKR